MKRSKVVVFWLPMRFFVYIKDYRQLCLRECNTDNQNVSKRCYYHSRGWFNFYLMHGNTQANLFIKYGKNQGAFMEKFF